MSSSNLGRPLVIWKVVRKIYKKKSSPIGSIIVDFILYDAQSSPFTRYRPRKLVRSEKPREGTFKLRSYVDESSLLDQSSRAK